MYREQIIEGLTTLFRFFGLVKQLDERNDWNEVVLRAETPHLSGNI